MELLFTDDAKMKRPCGYVYLQAEATFYFLKAIRDLSPVLIQPFSVIAPVFRWEVEVFLFVCDVASQE